ncbi:uncharacterized protein LOC128207006 [Mya arenaria]|uniref:uncharacterized protein LOC128207006 n=1 Tax=Mya arenaria TaxID=6604 RepID=UPI0022DF8E32|nr:uncharacterized protein LOC128207006 [Mya arenaria]
MLQIQSSRRRSPVFETKCASLITCIDAMKSLGLISGSGTTGHMVGKRTSYYIGGHCLLQCCGEDLCNNGCNMTDKALPTPPTTVLTTPTTTTTTTTTPTTTPTTTTTATTTPTTTSTTTTPPTTTPTTTTPTTTTPSCEHGLDYFRGSCYSFVDREMDFDTAKTYCEKQNAYMVRVETREENDFLANKIRELRRGYLMFWLGIDDKLNEGVWQYVGTNMTASFTNWAPNEPNGQHTLDGDDFTADCAIMSPYVKYQWMDEGCSPYEMAEPICEKRH